MTARVEMREVKEEHLPVLYQHQREPEANRMAAFPNRDWPSFRDHWAKIMADLAVEKRAILADGELVGNIVCYPQGDLRLTGYWLARAHWGRGLATRALARFLELVAERPLHAFVAVGNKASIRVLEKCGFTRVGVDGSPDEGPSGDDGEHLYVLRD